MLWIVLLCTLVSPSDAQALGCHGDFCYHLDTSAVTWSEASSVCRSRGNGGTLLMIKDAGDEAFIEERLRRDVESASLAEYWLGATHDSSVDWEYPHGGSTLDESTLPWATGYPATSADCVAMVPHESSDHVALKNIPCAASASGGGAGQDHFVALCEIDTTPQDCSRRSHSAYQDGLCYRLMADKVTWYEAKWDCHQDGGSLAEIRTARGFRSVGRMLLDQQALRGFAGAWIGLRKAKWVWQDGAEILYSSWAANFPEADTAARPALRRHGSQLQWLQLAVDARRSFVCQLPLQQFNDGPWMVEDAVNAVSPKQGPVCVDLQGEVVFVLDESGSIDDGEFDKQQEFVAGLIEQLDVAPDLVRIGLEMYSYSPRTIFHLGDHDSDPDVLKTLVTEVNNIGGGTSTHSALQYLREVMLHPSRIRPNLPRIGVVMTDGLSNYPQLTVVEAQKTRDSGILLFAVGVGGGIGGDELRSIASSSEHVFTAGSFELLNTLTKNLTGKFCRDIEEAFKLYPYGDGQSDESLMCGNNEDYCSSGSKQLDGGIYIQNDKYKNIKVHSNGFVTLGAPYLGREPRMFSSILTPGDTVKVKAKDGFVMLAPLWVDNNAAYPDSKRFYHVYYKSQASDNELEHVIKRAELDVIYHGGPSYFRATSVIVVTWVMMQPDLSPDTNELNTHQLVLIVDSMHQRTYMLWLYANTDWSSDAYVRESTIGYYVLNKKPTVPYTHPFTNTGQAFRMDTLTGNYGEPGTWFYSLSDAAAAGGPANYEQLCLDFYYKELNDTAPLTNPCPCDLIQANSDRRWKVVDMVGGRFCAHERVPVDDYSAMECCYDASSGGTNGALITTHDLLAGGRFRFHPVFKIQHQIHDLDPKDWCCKLSDMCETFYEARPLDTCETYAAPGIGTGTGDPHIESLDGLLYTFNGLGEYWLIQTDNEGITLQGRTDKAWNQAMEVIDTAAIFVALAAKAKSSDVFQVELDILRTELLIYLNKKDMTPWFRAAARNDEHRGHKVNILKLSDTEVEATFSSGFTLTVTVRENIMNFRTISPFKYRSRTKGLLGIYDDNQDNDFTLPSGASIPITSTEHDIFSAFGQKWKLMTPQDSIFYYRGALRGFEYYKTLLITPVYLDELIPSDEIKAVCGDDKSCLFDGNRTGSVAVAKATSEITKYNRENRINLLCIGQQADVVFVLDESGSITPENFAIQLQFVTELIDRLDVGPGQIHIGLETFSIYPRLKFNLGDHISDPDAMKSAVSSISQAEGGTATDRALRFLRDHMFTDPHSRPSVPHIGIVLTDGASNDATATAVQATETRAAGITLYAVGVGAGANPAELQDIASSPGHVFAAGSFDLLNTLTQNLTGSICRDIDMAFSLYPYGTSQGQTFLVCRLTDYCTSTTVSVDAGIHIGNDSYPELWVHSNGFVHLGTKFEQPDEHDEPASSWTAALNGITPTIQTSGIVFLAPHWVKSNAKSNASRVFYKVYYKNTAEYTHIINRAALDVIYYGGPNNYRPTSVIVSTWVDIQTATSPDKRNTVQMVLMLDSLHKHTYMLWLYEKTNWIWAKQSSRIGYFATSHATKINVTHAYANNENAFRMDKLSGNFGDNGTWFYTLTDAMVGGGSRNYEQLCLDFYYKELSDPAPLTNSCPCDLNQANSDRRWKVVDMGRRRFCAHERVPVDDYSAMECCYDVAPASSNGALITTSRSTAGGRWRFHPVFKTQHQIHDLDPKNWCCTLSNKCDKYYEARPLDDCMSYRPPGFGNGKTDPHIDTLDGLSYTFSGLGEYWLIQTDNNGFTLQGRTAYAWDQSWDVIDTATIFNALVAKDEASDVFQVELNITRTGFHLYLNKLDLSRWFREASPDDEYIGHRVHVLKLSDSQVEAIFSSGFTLTVEVREQMISFGIICPHTYSSRTKGLLGVFDGSQHNDFTLPSGTVIPINSTEQEIFLDFGQKWKLMAEADSVFYYRQAGIGFDHYKNLTITPVYFSQIKPSAEVKGICGDVKACLFDANRTGNMAVAKATLDITKYNEYNRRRLQNRRPIFSGSYVLNATVHVLQSLVVEVHDSDSASVSLTVTTSLNILKYIFVNKTGVFKWFPESVDSASIKFLAVDSDGGLAEQVVKVKLCSGCSGHGECQFDRAQDVPAPTAYFELVVCACFSGWIGTACEEDYDGCSTNPCIEASLCSDVAAADEANLGVSHVCSDCPLGYRNDTGQGGWQCTDIDECQGSPCQDNDKCTNTFGSYTCTCLHRHSQSGACQDCEAGSWGESCDKVCNCLDKDTPCYKLTGCAKCPPGWDGPDCRIDLDECEDSDNICGSNARCENIAGSYRCTCEEGYTDEEGTGCKEQNHCASEPCWNNGKCTSHSAGYDCTCQAGYGGPACQNDTNECDSSPCLNGGTCLDSKDAYSCQCTQGYHGQRCNKDLIPVCQVYRQINAKSTFNESISFKIVDWTYNPGQASIQSKILTRELAGLLERAFGCHQYYTRSFLEVSGLRFSSGSVKVSLLVALTSPTTTVQLKTALVDAANGGLFPFSIDTETIQAPLRTATTTEPVAASTATATEEEQVVTEAVPLPLPVEVIAAVAVVGVVLAIGVTLLVWQCRRQRGAKAEGTRPRPDETGPDQGHPSARGTVGPETRHVSNTNPTEHQPPTQAPSEPRIQTHTYENPVDDRWQPVTTREPREFQDNFLDATDGEHRPAPFGEQRGRPLGSQLRSMEGASPPKLRRIPYDSAATEQAQADPVAYDRPAGSILRATTPGSTPGEEPVIPDNDWPYRWDPPADTRDRALYHSSPHGYRGQSPPAAGEPEDQPVGRRQYDDEPMVEPTNAMGPRRGPPTMYNSQEAPAGFDAPPLQRPRPRRNERGPREHPRRM